MWTVTTKKVSDIDENGSISIAVDVEDENGKVRISDRVFSGDVDSIKSSIKEFVDNIRSADDVIKKDPLFKVGESFEV